MKKFTITAGHGANDPGAVAADGKTTEAALMTWLRDTVALKLCSLGHQVKTDGERWQNLPLVHALTLVPGSDVAVELHMNAAESFRATGVEVISQPTPKGNGANNRPQNRRHARIAGAWCWRLD